MIENVLVWLAKWREAGWFAPSGYGGFPVPDAWQGWVAFALLIMTIATTILLPRDYRQPAALTAIAAYAAVMYWTYRSDRAA